MIRGPEGGEIIPFPVWIIPFPVLKINFEIFESKMFCKRSFLIGCLEMGEIIPFPVLKIDFEPLGPNEKHLVKEVFSSEVWKWEK